MHSDCVQEEVWSAYKSELVSRLVKVLLGFDIQVYRLLKGGNKNPSRRLQHLQDLSIDQHLQWQCHETEQMLIQGLWSNDQGPARL